MRVVLNHFSSIVTWNSDKAVFLDILQVDMECMSSKVQWDSYQETRKTWSCHISKNKQNIKKILAYIQSYVLQASQYFKLGVLLF